MTKALGDFDASTVVYGKFSTYRPSTGASYTLAGTPSLSVYKDNSTTQSTAGVTLTVDFDSVTGLNHFTIDTSADGSFYSAGSFFDVVISAGTIDSVSVVGSVVGSFTIRKNSALKPTTAGRTLDVSTGGEAGLDWANIGSPTTAVNLSGTNIDVDQVVASVSGAVGSVTGLTAANLDVAVSSRMATYTQPTGFLAATFPGTVASPTNITAGTITTVTNLTNAPTNGDLTAAMKASVNTEIDSALSDVGLTTTITGRIDAAISTRLAAASYTTPPTAAAIADAVWDEAYSGHTTVGTFGKLMDTLRKANLSIDGSVNDATASTTVFKTTLTETTGAHDNKLLLITSGAMVGESRPILTYSSTNGTITLQDALTAAPANGIEFVIIPQHIHSIEEIADGVFDQTDAVESTVTLRKLLRGIASALLGKVSGAGTASVTFRNINDGKNVIVATVDASGNRSAVTLDLS